MAKRSTAPRAREHDVTYVVWHTQGTYRVTVPASWRVTYGAARPGASGPDSLRFYEGTKQRACLPDVKRFCDTRVRVAAAPEYAALEKLTGEPEGMPLL